MGSTASNWTTVTTLSEGESSVHHCNLPYELDIKTHPPLPPPAPQYLSPFSVDSNLTVIWLDWSESFALNGYLREFSVTESQLRVYTGFYSHLYIPRTSQKSEMYTQIQINKYTPLSRNVYFYSSYMHQSAADKG